MKKNNLCRSLIAYGSLAPGGASHELIAHLPGTWRKGRILGTPTDDPDIIDRGETSEIEAWYLEFADFPREKFMSPAYQAQRQPLYDRWEALDAALAPDWGRAEATWWPDGVACVRGIDGALSVNIYRSTRGGVPVYELHDAPSPQEETDIEQMWLDVVSGKKDYDESEFLGFLNDLPVARYEAMFGMLPNGAEFIARLKRFARDHAFSTGDLVHSDGNIYFYAAQMKRNRLGKDTLLTLLRADIEDIRQVLLKAGEKAEADKLTDLEFEFIDHESFKDEKDYSGEVFKAVELAGDILLEPDIEPVPHWYDCLSEAAYGLTAYYQISHWLMAPFNPGRPDFEARYAFWKAGGLCKFMGSPVHVAIAPARDDEGNVAEETPEPAPSSGDPSTPRRSLLSRLLGRD